MMDRRGFLAGMLAACAAPAIVRADSLMRIVPRELIVARPGLTRIPAGCYGEFMQTQWITREALRVLNENLEFAVMTNAQYELEFRPDADPLTIQIPERKFRSTGGLLAQKNRKPATARAFLLPDED